MAQFEGVEGKVTTEADPIGSSIVRIDPPRHRQLRTLVSQAFTPRMVAQLEPRITAIPTGKFITRCYYMIATC